MNGWEFWIDVGGTFTDCLARSPDGTLRTLKVLSSGVTKGRIDAADADAIADAGRVGDPPDFWVGYELRLVDGIGTVTDRRPVVGFDSDRGRISVDPPFAVPPAAGTRYELGSREEAPIVAIRTALGLRLADPIPAVTVKLGTTRGTNSLLTRSGARTALVTNRGFADVLRIGNQDRPRLFDLNVTRPEPLHETAVEIAGRLDANGAEIEPLDPAAVRKTLAELKTTGVESVAVCLMNAYANPTHERAVAAIAREVGFAEVSVSSEVAPRIKFVPRGDTTVVDAYLNPILREYVGRLRASLANSVPLSLGGGVRGGGGSSTSISPCTASSSAKPQATCGAARSPLTPGPSPEGEGGRSGGSLKVMSSAGGLLDADRFTGKDSVLSGPAGGVVGFSRTATAAGFGRAIGFDMGGTSTDVSRFDGRFDMQYEAVKAGVRLAAPMLAIETVAAGGGSVCRFDGVRLAVGPQSAGSDPGPACYGRGGPLTVTDVNLFLGRIPPERFPFPLDRSAVERRLAALCEEVAASPLGRRYSPAELAAGFRAIATEAMARAIRTVSVAKGCDPRDYVLVTFGGAGGQHACELAAALGMTTVLDPPHAGVLSAYGIGVADVRRFGERPVLQPLGPELGEELHDLFLDLAGSVAQEVAAEGVPADRIESPQTSLDLRYAGTESPLTVPWTGEAAAGVAAFETEHRRLYGYVRTGRPIEAVAARVEVVGRVAAADEARAAVAAQDAAPVDAVAAAFDGRESTVPVFDRAALAPGARLTGPAILAGRTSTFVLDPGWAAEVDGLGNLIARRTATVDSATVHDDTEAADPIRLELFNNLFAGIAEQMGEALRRTAVSTNVKERLDYSCAVFDAAGNLVVNAPHIPVHLGAMGETVRHVLADVPDLGPGDVIVTNDPCRGGSHLPDVTVVTPVHSAAGRLLFLTASRAHHAEIGGSVPGSMPPFSKSLAEEGVLIRNFRLIERGVSREDELRTLLETAPFPSRNVADNLADVAAQVAANRRGAELLGELVAERSEPVVAAYMGHIRAAAAEKVRLALRQLTESSPRRGDEAQAGGMPPDRPRAAGLGRVFRFADHLDDGSPIAVTVTVADGRATVDFTGTGPVLATNLNANRAIVTAAVMYVFRCLIAEDIPLNGGVLDPVEIVLPECLLNPPASDDPARCPAIVGGNVETSQRVVDVLLAAFGAAAASQGTMNNLTFGNDRGGYYETICGGTGATATADGCSGIHSHMTNTRLTDPEVLERRYPVRVRSFRLRTGSGGAGTHRGGDGIVRELEFLAPLGVAMLSERRGDFPPFGLAGGSPGAVGRNGLRRTDGSFIDLGGKFRIDVSPGETLVIETPGGGGFGMA